MTPDELRALADALFSGTHYVESPELHEAMMRAADYLRRCADAQPVAWSHVADPFGANDLEVTRTDPEDSRWQPLYTRPAPAAPQAEQWVTCSQCDGDFDRECPICDGLGRVLATDSEQTEPSAAQPMSDERIDEIGEPFGYFQYGDAQGDKRRAFIDRLTRARDEARAERDAMANVLPGHYYMDPPDGGDVPVLEQLRRMAKDAARYRFLSCKGVPPYFHRCSRWRLEYWNGEWWDPLMKEELDAAIDAQIEKEERP